MSLILKNSTDHHNSHGILSSPSAVFTLSREPSICPVVLSSLSGLLPSGKVISGSSGFERKLIPH